MLALAAIAAAVAGLLLVVGLRNNYFFPDEARAIEFGRRIAADPLLMVTDTTGIDRGPERMTSIVAAVAAALTGSVASELKALHVLMAMCQGLVVVPVYAIGRLLGLGRWSALVPAALSATGGFAVYGAFALNTSVGLVAAMAMVWAMLRTLVRPSLASDALVLVALGALAMSRLGWAPLALGMIPAVVAVMWQERPARERMPQFLWQLPRRMLGRHALLVLAAALGLCAAVALGSSALLGGERYGGTRVDPAISLRGLFENARYLGSRLALGLAVLPFVFGVPYLVRDMFRPLTRSGLAYGWLTSGMLTVFMYAYYLSMNEDRYFAVLAPLIAVAAALAVFVRTVPPLAVALTGAATAWLVASAPHPSLTDAFRFFVAPTSEFFDRVVLGKFYDLTPETLHRPTFAVAGLALAATLLAIVVRRPPSVRGPALAVGFAAVMAWQVAATGYAPRKLIDEVGLASVSDARLSQIERLAHGAEVQPAAFGGEIPADLAAQMPLLWAHNPNVGFGLPIHTSRRLESAARRRRSPGLVINLRDGQIASRGPVPRFLLEEAGWAPVGFAGARRPLSPPLDWARLVHLDQPATVEWAVAGAPPTGYPRGGRALEVRVFPGAREHPCLRGDATLPPLADRIVRFAVTSGRGRAGGAASPAGRTRFAVPLPPGRPSTVVVTGGAARIPEGGTVSPTIVNVDVEDDCAVAKRRSRSS